MSTAGGVPGGGQAKSMESALCRIVPGGELLDYSLPSGGFNIQAAASTGYLAGRQNLLTALCCLCKEITEAFISRGVQIAVNNERTEFRDLFYSLDKALQKKIMDKVRTRQFKQGESVTTEATPGTVCFTSARTG